MAVNRTESFTSATAGSNVRLATGPFHLSLSGLTVGSGQVDLERSPDGGSTWFTVKEYTADAEEVGDAVAHEGDVLYRLNCSAYTSGTFVGYLQQ